MSGFDVRVQELRAAAEAGRSAVTQIRALKPGEDLTTGTAGIPGATAIASITRVAQRWQDAISTWKEQTGFHAESLAASATGYAQGDSASAQTLSGLRQR